jgi:NTP pyrophosphatase (non-canonical NTP hydrolase)
MSEDVPAAASASAAVEQSAEASVAVSSSSSSAAPAFHFSPSLTLEDVRASHRAFSVDRDWEQFHTPRNLLLALVGEVGELSEVVQWKGELKEGAKELNEQERTNLADEISDCLLYLTAFAGQSNQRSLAYTRCVLFLLLVLALPIATQQCEASCFFLSSVVLADTLASFVAFRSLPCGLGRSGAGEDDEECEQIPG